MSTSDDDEDRLTDTQRRKEPDNLHPDGHSKN